MKHINEYQASRMRYNDNKPKEEKISQEMVAELCNTSLSTIKRIESGAAVPSSSLVASLSHIYSDPSLLRNYCATECAIGKALNKKAERDFKPKSLFEAGYGLITANQELDSFRNELFEILADGVVDDDEVVRLKTIMGNLEKVQEIIDVIKDMIKNHKNDECENI